MMSQITLYRPNERRLFTYRELSQIIDPKSTGGIIAIDNKKFIGECLPDPKQGCGPRPATIKIGGIDYVAHGNRFVPYTKQEPTPPNDLDATKIKGFLQEYPSLHTRFLSDRHQCFALNIPTDSFRNYIAGKAFSLEDDYSFQTTPQADWRPKTNSRPEVLRDLVYVYCYAMFNGNVEEKINQPRPAGDKNQLTETVILAMGQLLEFSFPFFFAEGNLDEIAIRLSDANQTLRLGQREVRPEFALSNRRASAKLKYVS